MLRSKINHPLRACPWLLAVPLLLLAATLAARNLDIHVFDADEASTIINSGGRHFGPYTAMEVWRATASNSPDQAPGYPLLISLWGRLAGWSELAIRAVSLFAGLLTLAWLYRTGRDLFTPAIGLLAVLLLAISQFFLFYMHLARAFTFVALFATLALWSYWRVAMHSRPPGRSAQAALLIAAGGLFHTHFFGVLLLPALGLFHLFLAPRGRRWWRAPALLALAALSFLPQLPVFLQGVAFNEDKGIFVRAMSSPEVLSHFIQLFSNSRFTLRPDFSGIALILVALFFVREQQRPQGPKGAGAFLVAITLALALLMLGVNMVVGLILPGRLRYMMALWPPVTLLLGLVLWRSRGMTRLALGTMTATIVLAGIWLERDPATIYSMLKAYRPASLAVTRAFQDDWLQDGLLIASENVFRNPRAWAVYTGAFPGRRFRFGEEVTPEAVLLAQTAREHERIWLLFEEREHLQRVALLTALDAAGWRRCLPSPHERRHTLDLLLAPGTIRRPDVSCEISSLSGAAST